ncbi:MAG TPA: peptide-methionine (S)-S-oxide reductase MsrA [Candidatus Acidoferrum sp.]|nr:peptide-methionine (S)-S-oxide reductase MsrA [Candidatus Acidoferrum sp.]
MRSPTIGRTLAVAAIVAFFGWNAVRSIGARPASEPRYPFPKPAVDAPLASGKSQQTAVLAGGCFWGVQAVFEHLKGVRSVVAGYSGGRINSPSYEMVSSGLTGHAESVSITFDPSQISYGQILMIFFSVAHDPTQLNRQGPDDGTQYRSAIFYSSEEQRRIAAAYIEQLDAAKVYPRKIVTEVVLFKAFSRAEDYHQDYLQTHTDQPYIVYNDLPKLEHLKKQFPEMYRN